MDYHSRSVAQGAVTDAVKLGLAPAMARARKSLLSEAKVLHMFSLPSLEIRGLWLSLASGRRCSVVWECFLPARPGCPPASRVSVSVSVSRSVGGTSGAWAEVKSSRSDGNVRLQSHQSELTRAQSTPPSSLGTVATLGPHRLPRSLAQSGTVWELKQLQAIDGCRRPLCRATAPPLRTV